jgi:hypothetical protein
MLRGISSIYIISKCWLVAWLAGCLVIICFLGDSEPYGIIFIICVLYNRYHGNAVKGFWALWDNTYDCVYCFRFSRLS